jgi:opacity protein-like surface antigen
MGATMMIARIKPPLAIAALVLATASTPAPAQELGWFAGLGIGYLKADEACPGASAGAGCDDKATTWKIFGGYQFNPYLGFELGLSDMGDWPASVAGLGAATAKFRVFEMTLVGTYPLSKRFDVYGKAGVFMWDADLEFPAGVAGGADADGNDYTYGLGLRVHVTPNAALRLEWQRYNNLGEQNMTGRFNADVFGIGALLRF